MGHNKNNLQVVIIMMFISMFQNSKFEISNIIMSLIHLVMLNIFVYLQRANSFLRYFGCAGRINVNQLYFKLNTFRRDSRKYGNFLQDRSFTRKASILTLWFALEMIEPAEALTNNLINSISVATNNKAGNNEYINKYLLQSAAANQDTLASPYNFGLDSQGSFNICPGSSYSLIATNCVSSQDDRPQYFLEPASYDGSWTATKNQLLQYLLSIPGTTILGDSNIDGNEESRYVHAKFAINPDDSNNGKDGEFDESEFYFTPNDSIMQFRSLRQHHSVSARDLTGDDSQYSYLFTNKPELQMIDVSQSNRKRMEMVIKNLNLEYIPVLRNRKSMFGIETPFDSFGPPTVIFDHNVDRDDVPHQPNIVDGLDTDDLVGLE